MGAAGRWASCVAPTRGGPGGRRPPWPVARLFRLVSVAPAGRARRRGARAAGAARTVWGAGAIFRRGEARERLRWGPGRGVRHLGGGHLPRGSLRGALAGGQGVRSQRGRSARAWVVCHVLGVVLLGRTAVTSDAITDTLQAFPRPETAKRLQTYLGLLGFWRTFIRGLWPRHGSPKAPVGFWSPPLPRG